MSIKPKRPITVVISLLIAMSALAYSCAHGGWFESDTTGHVIDVDTGKPIEGAYVMAVYNEAGGQWFVGSTHWCVATKGMYTGKDGKFHFPKGTGWDPQIHGIKPDYYLVVGGPEVQQWEQ